MNSMEKSRDAAQIRLTAQSQRHAEGDAQVEDVLEADRKARERAKELIGA